MTGERPLRVTVVAPTLQHATPWGGPGGVGAWEPEDVRWVQFLATYGIPFDVVTDPPASDAFVLHPDEAPKPDTFRDALALLVDGLGAVVRPDLRNVVVLRLDDPGSATKRLLRSWAHDDVSPQAWAALWDALDGFGRTSVFCCPAWVDGDGTVMSSRAASPGEWAALDVGVGRGVADLECHGFTHVHPDLGTWSVAPDRYDDPAWFRELAPPRLDREPTTEEQAGVLAAWQACCGSGTTLVAPGECWGLNTIPAAVRCGFQLFNSWEVCRLDLPTPTWTVGIGSPYLDEHEAEHLVDDLPAVAYWHDRDMALHGPDWAPAHLAAWRECGATRAWAFADLARAYAQPVDAVLRGGEVEVRSAPPVPLIVDR